jgi:hypothetical protein
LSNKCAAPTILTAVDNPLDPRAEMILHVSLVSHREKIMSRHVVSFSLTFLCLTLIITSYQACSPLHTFTPEMQVDAASVEPDIEAPTITITAPADGTTVTGITTLTVAAADNIRVAGVQYMVDGVNYGSEVTTAPFSLSFNSNSKANGVYSVTARARDAAGNVTVSAAISITTSNAAPDTVAPTVALTAPSSGAVTGTISVSATASDNVGVAGVQFLVDGVAVGAEDTSAPYAVSWDTKGVANGSHNVSARARDTAGNLSTSPAVSVTVNNVMAPTYQQISSTILVPKCVGCHGGLGGYSFNTYANTKMAVVAGNPNASALYNSVKPGGGMPLGGSLSTAEVQSIYDWIAAGALNN